MIPRRALTILIAAALLFAVPAAAFAEGERERAEAAWFRGYWLETGKRDMKAAKEAYESAAWEGESLPEIGIRAYLGLARTMTALGDDGAGQMLDAAVQYYERSAPHLADEIAKALKKEIDETTATLRPSEEQRSLADEIRYQILRMKNAWGTLVASQAKQRLVLYKEKAVPLLAKELEDSDPQHVRNVADILVDIATESAADALASAVGRPGVLYPEQIVGAAHNSIRAPIQRFLLGLFDQPIEAFRWVAATSRWDGDLGFRATLKMLGDESERIRERGAGELATVRPEDVPPELRLELLPLLQSGIPEVRWLAVRIAIAIGGEVTEKAVPRALVDPDGRVAGLGASALAAGEVPWSGDRLEPAVAGALTVLRDPGSSASVATHIVAFLAENTAAADLPALLPLVGATVDRDSKMFRSLVDRFQVRADLPATFVRDGYLSLKADADRATWLDAFSRRLGTEAIPLAREALGSRSEKLRRWAARTLLTDLPSEEWPDLEPLLADSDANVREAAIAALIRRDREAAIPRIATVLVDDANIAGYVFGTVAKELGVEAYRKLLDAVSGSLTATRAGFAGKSEFITDEQVLAALRTRSPYLAQAVAPIAANRHLLDAWPLLLEIDGSAAKTALDSIRGYYLGQREYRDFLERLDSDAFEKAKALAASEDVVERVAAATALGALGDRQAIGLLLDLVRDTELTVRDAAMRALERISSTPRKEE